MTIRHPWRWAALALCLNLFVANCSEDGLHRGETDSGLESGVDATTDSPADGNANRDTNTHTDGNTDAHADLATDGNTDADAGMDADTDSSTEAGSDYDCPLSSTGYYVTATGGGTNWAACQCADARCTPPPGASCTLTTANGNAAPGVCINLAGGTYAAANIRPAASGSSGNPIIYRTYGDSRVTMQCIASGSTGENMGCLGLGGRNHVRVVAQEIGGLKGIHADGDGAYGAIANMMNSNYLVVDGVHFDCEGYTGTPQANYCVMIQPRFQASTGPIRYLVFRNNYVTGPDDGPGDTIEGPDDGLYWGKDVQFSLFEGNQFCATDGSKCFPHIAFNSATDPANTYPSNNVIRNNRIYSANHSAVGCYGCGERNIWEGNVMSASGDYDSHPILEATTGKAPGNAFQYSGNDNVIRYNTITKGGTRNMSGSDRRKSCGMNFVMTDDRIAQMHNNQFYNNTVVENQGPGVCAFANDSTNAAKADVLLNNVLYDNGHNGGAGGNDDIEIYGGWAPVSPKSDVWGTNFIDNGRSDDVALLQYTECNNLGPMNAAELEAMLPTSDCHTWDTVLTGNPGFTSYAEEDYTLTAGSQLRDAGTSLTTVATADTGSGATLRVASSRPFQALSVIPGVAADWIAVGTVDNTVQISSIDHATSTITLASPIARQDGDDVWLYKDSDGTIVLTGSAPDIGAFEY